MDTQLLTSFTPSSRPKIRPQMPIKPLTPHRHLKTVKRILQNIIHKQFITPAQHALNTLLHRLREQQKFSPRKSLETRQAKSCGLQHFQPGQIVAAQIVRCSDHGGRQGARDGVHTVEGSR